MNIQISSSLEKLEYCLHCIYIPAWQNLVGAELSPFPLVRQRLPVYCGPHHCLLSCTVPGWLLQEFLTPVFTSA